MTEDIKIRKLEARISRLEQQVDFLLQINGLDLSGLRDASDDTLLKHYRDAVQLLGFSDKQLTAEVCESWSKIFCQLSEFEFVRLQDLVDYRNTWEPFYHLCVRMMTAVRRTRGFTQNGMIQSLYAVLEKGRKGIRDEAVIMSKKTPQELSITEKALLNDGTLSLQ